MIELKNPSTYRVSEQKHKGSGGGRGEGNEGHQNSSSYFILVQLVRDSRTTYLYMICYFVFYFCNSRNNKQFFLSLTHIRVYVEGLRRYGVVKYICF